MIIEVCASSVEDCLVAQSAGANRIELVSASYLGGLTPTTATLDMIFESGVSLPIMAMVRPRGGGFCYSELEKELMYREGRELLKHGANGLVFGFLTADGDVDWSATEKMIELCNSFGAESVFHRAFDCAKNPEYNIERLIGLGCTRVLTSGLASSAKRGAKLINLFQEKYGQYIELLVGAGVTSDNIEKLIEKTAATQFHGTFKKYEQDPTTSTDELSFAYTDEGDYEKVDAEELERVVNIVRKYREV